MVNSLESNIGQNNVNYSNFEEKNIKKENYNKESFVISKVEEKVEEYTTKEKEFLSTCTDGQDDGKIGFKEGAKAFLGGVANHYLDVVEDIKNFVKENPIKTAALTAGALAIGGLTIITLGAPFLIGVISTAGIALGVKSVVNGVKSAVGNIKEAKNATTDADKKAALYGLGGNSAEVVDGALAIYGGVKGIKEVTSIISQSDDVAKLLPDVSCDDETLKQVKELLKRAENGTLSQDEIDILKEFYDKKDDIFTKETLNGVLFGVSSKIFNFV